MMSLLLDRGRRTVAIAVTFLTVLVLTIALFPLDSARANAVVPMGPAAASSIAETAGPVKAADLSQFRPGNIVSDAVFFDRTTMTEAQIQSFLEQRVPKCESGYTCLRDWYDTSRTTSADAMCGAYSGGTRERASRIIYKVAQACGINPQVILVTLQKEQGLVTHVWPSEWRYTAAMGQGCPDTAACDSRYYGFFNQVYGAAWQLKRYANPPGTSQYFTWYAPGKTWNILYNPNRNCGSSAVYVENQATSNLYYYTPYQPNAASLRAGYGQGDGCSSYGNRNFYQYFTDWFGSTQRDHIGEIQAEYVRQGGASSLGAPTSAILTLTKNGGGYARAFENGSIYWTTSTGAQTVRPGTIRDYYFARGGADGAIGWPMASMQTVTGQRNTGTAQPFTGGSVYSSSAGTYIVKEPLRAGYFSYSGAAGALGWPSIEEICYTPGCRQNFEGGAVVSSAAGSYGVLSSVLPAYDAAGGVTGAWGVPLMNAAQIAENGGGLGQAFSKGSAYARQGGGAVFVSGAIRDFYFSLKGASGRLGFPVDAVKCVDASNCQQQFQFGWIIWGSTTGARIGDPAIDAAYAAAGGQSGVLGKRAGGFYYYADNGGGFAEVFANGAIFSKPSRGAFPVTGAVRDAYFAAGGAAGPYGWPTSSMTCTQNGCRQNFEGGAVVSSAAGSYGVLSSVLPAYDAAGGVTGAWGVPLMNAAQIAENGGGLGQAFSKGSAYARQGGGAVFVSGAIRDFYFSLKGASGRLGFPVDAVKCADASNCQQQFQFGWIIWGSTSGARIGDPAIDAAYAAAGAQNGVLGKRAGGFYYYGDNGGGFAEVFANGAIFFKPARGAFPVTGAVRDTYFAAGGAAGMYGWPTSTMTCTQNGCRQNFEGGEIAAVR